MCTDDSGPHTDNFGAIESTIASFSVPLKSLASPGRVEWRSVDEIRDDEQSLRSLFGDRKPNNAVLIISGDEQSEPSTQQESSRTTSEENLFRPSSTASPRGSFSFNESSCSPLVSPPWQARTVKTSADVLAELKTYCETPSEEIEEERSEIWTSTMEQPPVPGFPISSARACSPGEYRSMSPIRELTVDVENTPPKAKPSQHLALTVQVASPRSESEPTSRDTIEMLMRDPPLSVTRPNTTRSLILSSPEQQFELTPISATVHQQNVQFTYKVRQHAKLLRCLSRALHTGSSFVSC
jgi:septal ring-binding cell division protein DamX